MRVHGGYELRSRDGIDLSVNINPYGPHPDLFENLNLRTIVLYPDPSSRRFRRRVAQDYQVDEEQLVIGNGASELIWAASRAFLEKGDRAVVIRPTFSELESAARQRGVTCIALDCDSTFHYSPRDLAELIHRVQPKVVSLCNPNSPTGLYTEATDIQEIAAAFPDILILLDESFLSLSDHHGRWTETYPDNVVRIVSLTKDHAIPGLRLGFALGSRPHIRALAAELPSWNVNGLAQDIGLFLFERKDYLDDCRKRIFRDRNRLQAALEERDIPYIPSSSCFLMMRGTNELADRLAKHADIHVRSCASYGYPEWWRIAVRPPSIQDRFFAALDALKG